MPVASGRMNRIARPLDHDAVRAALVGLWARVDFVERTGSTNADLLAAAAAGAPDRAVLVAEHQEAGRGRLGAELGLAARVRAHRERAAAPRRGVAASRLGWLTLLAGLAAHDAVRASPSPVRALKWPNDLLLSAGAAQGRAGILAEVPPPEARGRLGIGLNVAAAPADQPRGHRRSPPRASTWGDRTALLIALLTALHRRESAWRAGRGDPDVTRLRADYRAACAASARRCGWSCPAGRHTGIAEDVDTDGRLLLLDPAGIAGRSPQGDVVHLRPVDRPTRRRPATDGRSRRGLSGRAARRRGAGRLHRHPHWKMLVVPVLVLLLVVGAAGFLAALAGPGRQAWGWPGIAGVAVLLVIG